MILPTLNVNKVLKNPRFRSVIPLYRREMAVDDYGRAAVVETEIPIGAVIRPATQKDLERLPEGDRDRGHIKVLSEFHISTGDETIQPDEVLFMDQRWICVSCDAWKYGPGFYSALFELKAEVSE